ncbi:MAG TPA: ComEA family DNA-binding protein [Paenalcaligenes sp.]|nr:ComEA family DNA-binding protein [Paenalcaligenes sp.]
MFRQQQKAGFKSYRSALRGILLLSFLFIYTLPVVAVDLNQASHAELQRLPGIGPKTAETIVEERERGGAFTSLQDLSARVRGIGPKKLEALQEAGLVAQDPDAEHE